MKKFTAAFCAIVLCFSLSACAGRQMLAAGGQEDTAAPAPEPFESMKISYIQLIDLAVDLSLKELMENNSLIVIASPINTFTDGAPLYLDANLKVVDTIEQAAYSNKFTKRPFKIHKVLKGDAGLKEIMVAEKFYIVSDNGEEKILGYADESIAKKNVKYLMFLNPLGTESGCYIAGHSTGKINIDGLDIQSDKLVDHEVLKEVKEYYKNEFEYIAEPFESLDVTYTSSSKAKLNTLDELKESADLIVVASTDTTFTDCKSVIINEFNQKTNNINAAIMEKSYTPRDFKVHKVIKGDKSIKNVTVAESVIGPYYTGLIALNGEYIAKADTKYLMFLKADENNPNLYYTYLTQGKFNVDGKDSKRTLPVDNKMLNEIKKEYKAEFEY